MNNNERIEIFKKYGIDTILTKSNHIIISHYKQPKEKTFSELGINEDDLIETVAACLGIFDTNNSTLTTFPLEAAHEVRLDENSKIVQMPNLRVVNKLFVNSKLKKLPKIKEAGTIILENSQVSTLSKLKKVNVLIAQNSSLKDLSSLEQAEKLCIVDCLLEDLKELKTAQEIFICSSNENEKIDIKSLSNLEEIEQLFIANSTLKNLPKLKKAEKIALYNCEVKNIKPAICKNVEIKTHISDEELSEKFDTFTNWQDSDILNKSMDLLGDFVKLQGVNV